jgi:glutaredoxin-like protein NrdH
VYPKGTALPSPTTVYTTPSCVQCRLTKKWLDDHHVPYETVDLSTSPDDMAAVKALGYQAAPVIITHTPAGDAHWSGFRPGFLAAHFAEAAA